MSGTNGSGSGGDNRHGGTSGDAAGTLAAMAVGYPASGTAYTPDVAVDIAAGIAGRPHPRTLATIQALHDRMRDRRPGFVPRRALFYNYWLFQEQEFHFVDGKLLLRGKNTTGKTTVLASILPLLLDADKRAQRLDPFGDGSRKLVGYLIGKPDDTEDRPTFHRKRTGYIALELEHGATGRYVTLCLGLKGTRHEKSEPKLEWWGFVLDDGRRLGPEGIRLWEPGHKEPLDRTELRRRLGPSVRLCEHNDDYAADVNRALFGFESLADFHGLMETLTLLRSPKLNKDTKPPAVAAMLDDSHPPVDPEVLGKATGTIARIDDAERQRQDTVANLRAAEALHAGQEECVRLAAQATGFELMEAVRELEAVEKELARAQQSCVDAERGLADVRATLATAQAKLHADRVQKEELQNNPAYRELAAQVEAAERAAREAAQRHQAARREADRVARAQQSAVEATAAALNQREKVLAASEDAAEALARTAGAARWPMTTRFSDAARVTLAALRTASVRGAPGERDDVAPALPSLVALRAAWDTRKAALTALLAALDAVSAADREVERREERRQERDLAFREALEREQKAGDELVAAATGAGVAVAEWAASVPGGAVGPSDIEAAAQSLVTGARLAARTDDGPPPKHSGASFGAVDAVGVDGVQHDLELPLQARDERLAGEEDEARTRAGDLRRVLDRAEADLRALREERDLVPPPRPGRVDHRARLEAAGVRVLPLYQACDVVPELAPADAIRLEQALEESGLLDALVALDQDAAAQLEALVGGAGGVPASGERTLGEHWLRPAAPVAGRSLAAALRPVEGVAGAGAIRSVLASVAWPDAQAETGEHAGTGAALGADGRWALGPMRGRAHDDGREAPRYLGVENRQRARAEAIARLERQIEDLRADRAEAEDRIQALREERRRLLAARRSLAGLACWGVLRRASETLRSQREQFIRARRDLDEAERALQKAVVALQAARLRHREAVQAVPDLDGAARDAVTDARNAGQNALDAAAGVVRAVDVVRAALAAAREAIRRQGEAEWDKDAALETLGQAAAEAEELARRHDELRAELGGGEAADLAERIQRLTAEIARLDADVRRLERETGRLMKASETSAKEVAGFQTTKRDRESAADKAYARFVDALKRYASPTFTAHHAAAKGGRHAAVDTAKALLQRRRERTAADARDTIGKDARAATSALGRAFAEHRAALMEFSPQQTTDGDVFFRLGHRPVMAHEMVTHLTAMRDEQARIIQENETELYERFIRQELLSAIRTCILKARDYAVSVNARMAQCPVPGKQYLSLTWKPRRERLRREAKSERSAGLERLVSGVRFPRLVELLDHDVAFLPASEQEELRTIFKELITQVREVAAQEGSTVTLQDGLATVLDYRSWFEFRLQYHEGAPEERPSARDLTTPVYQLGSGAQKAMYVMVPLLAALETKLQGARHGSNAPRFFGIDEAFAGIDAEHTATLFALMESMRYSWVMTSPVLWASARELPGSATYDFTLEGAFVGTDLFVWDGTRRLSDADHWEDGVVLTTVPVRSNEPASGNDHSADALAAPDAPATVAGGRA